MEEQKKIGYHHKYVEIYATTFLMPIIFYITLFVWEGIYPFGEKSNLIWDLEVQYVDYYNFFREFLKNRSGGRLSENYDECSSKLRLSHSYECSI